MPADRTTTGFSNPANVDWHAVAAGRVQVRVRQLPGPANSMGRVKIRLSERVRHLSSRHAEEGSVRAGRSHHQPWLHSAGGRRASSRWLLGRDPQSASAAPEQNVLLPTPVPIYITYLTAQVNDGQLSFVDDIYGRDGQATRVAALK